MAAGIGALGVKLSVDTADFAAGLDRAAQTSQREMARIERANKAAAKEVERLASVVQRQIDTFGLSGTALLRYDAQVKGAADRVGPLIDRLEAMKKAAANADQFDAGAKALNRYGVSAGQTAAALRTLPAQFTDIATQLQGGQNPLTILLQQGGQIKDSFGGIRPALAGLATYITPVSVAVGALAVVAGGMVAAFVQGSQEAEKFAKSLALTGNFAGVTAGQVDTMARAIAASVGTHIGKAREAIEGLVATGDVGPRALAPLAAAIAAVQRLTGEDTEKIVAHFARMGEGVAKWAAEANKSYNFLTTAQYEYIKRLEEQGRKEEAEAVTARALADVLGTRMPQSLGYLQSALKTAGDWWDAFWTKAKNVGAPETIDQQLAKLQAKLDANAQARMAGSAGYRPTTVDRLPDDEIRRQMELLEAAREADTASKMMGSYAAATHKAGVAASEFLDRLNQQARGADNLKQKLDELHRRQAEYRADGGVLSAAEVAAQEAEVRRQNRPHPVAASAAETEAKRIATEIRGLIKTYDDEAVKLRAETVYYERYGRSLDSAREAVAKFRTTQGDLRNATPADKAAAVRSAGVADIAEQGEREAKATEAIRKKTAALIEEASARAVSARQAYIAAQLNDKEIDELTKGSAAYKRAVADRTAAAGRAFDAKVFEPAMKAWQDAIGGTVDKLQQETEALGRGELARRKLAATIQLEAQARAELLKYPEQEARIEADLAIAKARVTSEIERNYEASRRFETGESAALAKYQEDATNAAAHAERVIGGGLSRMEDAFVQFSRTGRLNLGSLFQFMADEFLRQQARMVIAAATNGAGGDGGILGALIGGARSFFGLGPTYGGSVPGGTGVEGAIGNNPSAYIAATSLAVGTNFVPYDGMPAVLHRGEAVVPAAYNPAAGGAAGGDVYVTVENHGARVETREEARPDGGRGLRIIIDAARAAVAQDVRSGGDVAAALQGTYGLNRGAGVLRGA